MLYLGIKRAGNGFRNRARLSRSFCFSNSPKTTEEDAPPAEWYIEALPKMEKLADELHAVDVIDGVLVSIADNRIIIDDRLKENARALKSLIRQFIACPNVQRKMRDKFKAFSQSADRVPVVPFTKKVERESAVITSLTQVSSFFNISAQKKKLIRFKVCPQVTQHHIWVGALKEILNGLKSEMKCTDLGKKTKAMAEQIIAISLSYLSDSDSVYEDPNSYSWMRLNPTRTLDCEKYLSKWQDFHDVVNDLVDVMGNKKGLFHHMEKLEAMKEGLSQIRDVVMDKRVGYREARFQDGLISKMLTKALGHPSRCLFTLVMYYLYGHVRDPEVDLCGGAYSCDKGKSFIVFMGRILISKDDNSINVGVKQLSRVLGVHKLIWELAEMKEPLVLEGHLWCVGEVDRVINYRDILFYVHGIAI